MNVQKLKIYADKIFGYPYMLMEMTESKYPKKLQRIFKE
jgi:hypothetical protein